MKKSVQGKMWKKDSPLKGSLNEITCDKDIRFVEPKTKDCVQVHFKVSKNQYALYSEEYKPETVSAEGHKKSDITAFIAEEGEKEGKAKYYIAEVKKDVGDYGRVTDIIAQWNDGLHYVRHTLLAFLGPEVKKEGHIMVITRNFDVERIEREKNKKEEELQECLEQSKTSIIAKKKLSIKGAPLKKDVELLKQFISYRFPYEKEGNTEILPFEVATAMSQSDDTYLCELFIEL